MQVLFATHSIPSTDAAKSGPEARGFDDDGAYAAQHQAVAEVVMAAAEAALELDLPRTAARPSPGSSSTSRAAARPRMPWLEPDINDAIDALAGGPTRPSSSCRSGS